ncbi:MAG: 5-formyltetrahydrofolate cyclo-ligase [Bacteroidales bacterium]|nr:5-formyltetrahydrofolate cyclo-ligase [Candidatus Physcousia equi]
MTKQELRREIRNRKTAMTATMRSTQSRKVCERVLQHPRWEAAHTILLYHALPDEIDTTLLIERAGTKRLLLPVVKGEELELREFAHKLHVGPFGILEPSEGSWVEDYQSIDLLIVPGMAFDNEGHRLGRGKGYYDKFFAKMEKSSHALQTPSACAHHYKIGICFDFQHVEAVPSEPHDVLMDEVICG